MTEPNRSGSRHESGRTEVIQVEGGRVVATEMIGDDGVPWIAFTRLDDVEWDGSSDEARPLP